jgi:small subunit ribosomal protein S16
MRLTSPRVFSRFAARLPGGTLEAVVKIRLSRAGAKRRPFYRLVAIDERAPRDGRPLEFLGTYNPVSNPEQIRIRSDRVEAWLSRGAQMTDAVRALVRRAQREAPTEGAAPAGESEPQGE